MTYSDAVGGALSAIYSQFGVSATFSPLEGDDVSLTVILDIASNWQPAGVVQVALNQIVVNYQRSDIDRKVLEGETFTIGGTVYTVLSMADYPGSWTTEEGKAAVTVN